MLFLVGKKQLKYEISGVKEMESGWREFGSSLLCV